MFVARNETASLDQVNVINPGSFHRSMPMTDFLDGLFSGHVFVTNKNIDNNLFDLEDDKVAYQALAINKFSIPVDTGEKRYNQNFINDALYSFFNSYSEHQARFNSKLNCMYDVEEKKDVSLNCFSSALEFLSDERKKEISSLIDVFCKMKKSPSMYYFHIRRLIKLLKDKSFMVLGYEDELIHMKRSDAIQYVVDSLVNHCKIVSEQFPDNFIVDHDIFNNKNIGLKIFVIPKSYDGIKFTHIPRKFFALASIGVAVTHLSDEEDGYHIKPKYAMTLTDKEDNYYCYPSSHSLYDSSIQKFILNILDDNFVDSDSPNSNYRIFENSADDFRILAANVENIDALNKCEAIYEEEVENFMKIITKKVA